MARTQFNLEEETIKNENYRDVIFTGKHLQLVLMSLKPGEEIGMEVHHYVDQFFRIEKGQALVDFITKSIILSPGHSVVVPAGTRHNVINNSKTDHLKLYTIYSPPNHPPNTRQKEKPRENDCRSSK